MKNPFLKHIRIYLFVWLTIGVMHAAILHEFSHVRWYLAIADSFIYNALYAGVAIDFWYAVRFLNIEKQKPVVLIFAHIIAVKVFLMLWMIAGNYLMNLIDGGDTTYRQFTMTFFLARALSGLFYYFIIILVYYLFIYYSSFLEKLTREAHLRTLVKETELSLLRSQLNPHFIFNSLNSISSLTITNPSAAQDMLVKLSSYLRYALEDNKNRLIPFVQELENSLLYLEIEKVRFGDKLIFEKEISPEINHALVPNMILQPLLENAIKHGVYESQEPVVIHLECRLEHSFLRIKISNNFEYSPVEKKGRGIGLRNVQERLQLIYGKKELLTTGIRGAVFETELLIPQN